MTLEVVYSLESQQLRGNGLYFPETCQDTSRYSLLALSQEVDFVSLYDKLLLT
ncbi:MAG: hypothetical protein AAFO04_28115 [Cyanobacteria bacterium J06592_8]